MIAFVKSGEHGEAVYNARKAKARTTKTRVDRVAAAKGDQGGCNGDQRIVDTCRGIGGAERSSGCCSCLAREAGNQVDEVF